MAPPLLAASVTPLRDGGATLDEAAIAPLVRHLQAGGVDGIFCCGTTGEGVMLTLDERQRTAAAFRSVCDGDLIVHCGAQTTADTVALCQHAAAIGADGVAVIPPPYYPFTADEQVEHFVAAATACDPLPFYMYAFTARSGYPLSVDVIGRVREQITNLAGLKVSESPFDAVAPYLELGLRVFVGNEPLIPQALAAGAHGAVSGLANAFPGEVARLLREPTAENAERVRELRDALGGATFVAAVKCVLRNRGVPIEPDMRAPLRPLSDEHAARIATL
jgi:dihydrodipicolinate synthase/N-acetylneuraminate lyase